jgi:hypothetical protein
MSRSSIIPVFAMALVACAPSTHSTAFRQVAPKASAEQVEIFTEGPPEQPYEELGVIEVSASELSNSRYGDLIQRARVRAAEMGADAIIVTRDPATRTTGFAYVPPQKKKTGQLVSATSRTRETPRIQVTAIAWKAGSTNVVAKPSGDHTRCTRLGGRKIPAPPP